MRIAQHVKARRQRLRGLRHVHVCNRLETPPLIAYPLHATVALSIRRMRGSVFAPVAQVAGAPFRLRAGLVVAIVAVDTKPVVLPVASTGALTSLRGAISLTGNMQQWQLPHERMACAFD